MSVPTSRQELTEYCLRKLGSPVIKINVAPEQVDDRVDEALQYFQEFHFDAIEHTYFIHKVTAEDLTNHYIPTNEIPGLVSVIDIVEVPQAQFNIFDVRYQVMLNDFYNFNNASMIHYQIARQHLALLEFLFSVHPTVSFNRKMDKIFVNMDWNNAIVDDFIIFEITAIVDPENYPKVYNDRWLKDYATALIKKQWADNLTKWGQIQLPGGPTLNGMVMLEDAKKEIDKLQNEVKSSYMEPPQFFLG